MQINSFQAAGLILQNCIAEEQVMTWSRGCVHTSQCIISRTEVEIHDSCHSGVCEISRGMKTWKSKAPVYELIWFIPNVMTLEAILLA